VIALGVNPIIIQKHLFSAEKDRSSHHMLENPSRGRRDQGLFHSRSIAPKTDAPKSYLLSESPKLAEKIRNSDIESGMLLAEKYADVGHYFKAGCIYLKLGLMWAGAPPENGTRLLSGKGKECLREAVECFSHEMVLYGHDRPKTEKEKLWEFDPYTVHVPAEHPVNYRLIAKCFCELGDYGDMGKAVAREKELRAKIAENPQLAFAAQALELRRRIMDAYFSPRRNIPGVINEIKSAQGLLGNLPAKEAYSFLCWTRGLFQMKNPFQVVRIPIGSYSIYSLDTKGKEEFVRHLVSGKAASFKIEPLHESSLN